MTNERFIFFFLLGIASLGGCFRPLPLDPNTLPTEDHARTLEEGRWEVGAGILVPRQESLGINLPVRYGLSHDIELRTNAAHVLLGVPNLTGEWTAVKEKWGAMSIAIGGLWLHPPLLTLLPDSATKDLGDVHLISIPIVWTTSFTATNTTDLSVKMSYYYTQFVGTFSDDQQSGMTGGIGIRELVIEPIVLSRIEDHIWLFGSLELPLWGQVPAQADGQLEVAPGVVVGVSGSSATTLDVLGLYTVRLGLETRAGEKGRFRLYLTKGQRFLESRSDAILPGFELIARF